MSIRPISASEYQYIISNQTSTIVQLRGLLEKKTTKIIKLHDKLEAAKLKHDKDYSELNEILKFNDSKYRVLYTEVRQLRDKLSTLKGLNFWQRLRFLFGKTNINA